MEENHQQRGVFGFRFECFNPPLTLFEMPEVVAAPAQRGNPLWGHVRSCSYRFAEAESDMRGADYILGAGTAGLFVSLRFHLLNPTYVSQRLAGVRGRWARVLLFVYADAPRQAVVGALDGVQLAAVSGGATTLVAWSWEEVARYIEAARCLDGRSAALIRDRRPDKSGKRHRLTDAADDIDFALRPLRPTVNATDVRLLLATMGTLQSVAEAPRAAWAGVRGMGPQKVALLQHAMRDPFRGHPVAEEEPTGLRQATLDFGPHKRPKH